MGLQERVYSVLIVSASESFNGALLPLLPSSSYDPVHTASDISTAKRMVADRFYDFILINAPLPDEPGTRFAIDVSSSSETVVLLMVRNEIHDETYEKVAPYGVFTLPKPTSKPIMLQALNWLASARERLRQSEQKALSIEEKMESIRLVNRAKWLLISELKMSEADAHRYIEKQAMDRCVSKKKIAQIIIQTYS